MAEMNAGDGQERDLINTDGEHPELSVVMPCLNEEEGLAGSIRSIRSIFLQEGIDGEIVVSDNGSTDNSRRIALAEGCRVVEEPVRGYGAAYLRGLSAARGDLIIMADSDHTYDFGAIPDFVRRLREGCDLVMGSRFKGTIHRGAMPWARRYIGNPVLSSMTRLLFRTRLSDIHCGMRGLRRSAVERMNLQMPGMEFATEMVVAAVNSGLRIAEVPVNYFPRKGISKLNPFTDAWRHVRFMLLLSPMWLYIIPGLTGFIAGMLILLIRASGAAIYPGRRWDLLPMAGSAVLCIFSSQLLHLGLYAQTFAADQGILKPGACLTRFRRCFSLERGVAAGVLLVIVSLAIGVFISIRSDAGDSGGIGALILPMTLLVIGLQTVFSSFLLSLLSLRRKPSGRREVK